ncbi:MAG TPA: DUF1697 domain-containing protein [Solirubrobacteraceae bacterium]|nr:DUF1697 domain-containing protein [Solirubrobacteraceae bacterium]
MGSGMTSHAAFLRGMNVGGHRLTNDELRTHFEAMGFGGVASFRASGNVVFAAAGEPPDELVTRIERGLAAALGYEVPTFIRSSEQLRAMAALRPFAPERVAASAGKLQVALLTATPSAQAAAEVLSLAGEEDALAFGERELYWLPSGGILDSALDLKSIAKLLGPMTMRTKGTIEQLAAKHFP